MRIYSLALKNIGPFKEEEIQLKDEAMSGESVTVITGMNGTGKSVIIDAIRTLLSGTFSHNLERNIIRNVEDFYIQARVSFDTEFKTLKTVRFSDKSGSVYTNDDLDTHIYHNFTKKPTWILDYWSSFINRSTYKISSIQSLKPEDYLKNSLVGSQPNTDISKLITFFDYLKGSSNDKEKKVGEYMFNKAVEIINSCLLEAEFTHVSRQTLDPIIKTTNSEITLEKLSSGNSYLIQRLLSLLNKAYSVFRLSGGEISEICKVEGLLLMDEAEHHLHPKWQKVLLQNVLGFFPNLQIILTTHSPFLVSSIENARLLVTRKDGDYATIEDKTADYENKPFEEILRSSLFETDSFNSEISDLLSRRKLAIKHSDDGTVKQIEENLIKINPEYFKYLNIDNL